MNDLRTVQRQSDSGWDTIEFQALKDGDTFRMFEPDGKPVYDENNNAVFLATNDPFINKVNVWEINIFR